MTRQTKITPCVSSFVKETANSYKQNQTSMSSVQIKTRKTRKKRVFNGVSTHSKTVMITVILKVLHVLWIKDTSYCELHAQKIIL